jgi:hypothetical protein
MNFFIVGDAIFEVEKDGILDVFQRFFIGVALGITALQLWAGGEVAIFVLLEQDGKKKSAHRFCGDRMIIFYDFFCRLALASAQSYRGCRTILGVTSRRLDVFTLAWRGDL